MWFVFCMNFLCSSPLYTMNWVYFLSSQGRKFRKVTKVIHELPLRVIRERREEYEQNKRLVLFFQIERRKNYKNYSYLCYWIELLGIECDRIEIQRLPWYSSDHSWFRNRERFGWFRDFEWSGYVHGILSTLSWTKEKYRNNNTNTHFFFFFLCNDMNNFEDFDWCVCFKCEFENELVWRSRYNSVRIVMDNL